MRLAKRSSLLETKRLAIGVLAGMNVYTVLNYNKVIFM